MVRNGILKFVLVATLTFGGAAVTAQDQMKDQKGKEGHKSGMMMQGQHGDMDMDAMGSGMGHGMGPMMGMGSGMMGGMGTCPMMGGMSSMKGMGHGMGPMMGMHGADLTEKQQEQLAELHGEQAKQQFMLMQKMQEPRQRLEELMKADQMDMDAIGEAYDKLADLRKEALMTRLEHKQKMQDIIEE